MKRSNMTPDIEMSVNKILNWDINIENIFLTPTKHVWTLKLLTLTSFISGTWSYNFGFSTWIFKTGSSSHSCRNLWFWWQTRIKNQFHEIVLCINLTITYSNISKLMHDAQGWHFCCVLTNLFVSWSPNWK